MFCSEGKRWGDHNQHLYENTQHTNSDEKKKSKSLPLLLVTTASPFSSWFLINQPLYSTLVKALRLRFCRLSFFFFLPPPLDKLLHEQRQIRCLVPKLNRVVNIVERFVMSELIAATSGGECSDDKSHTFSFP